MSEEDNSTGVGKFLKLVFGSLRGICHIETIELDTRKKVHEFFEWPIQQVEATKFIVEESATGKEVYFSPALFKDSSSYGKENVLGSRAVWATFDEKKQFKSKLVVDPSIKVSSGGDDCEHWYWLIDHPLMDANEIERINQGLANTLDGNPRDWDSHRVLRIPGTFNRKYGEPRSVKILRKSSKEFDISEFDNLQPYSKEIVPFQQSELIRERRIVGQYRWPDELLDLFVDKKRPAQRLEAEILRLALGCASMGMPYKAIESALHIWNQKHQVFAGYDSPEKEIAKLVIRALEEFPPIPELDEQWSLDSITKLEGFTVKQFKEKKKEPAEWLFRGLLIRGGLGLFAGTSGVGKTQIGTQLGLRAANGEDFLMWKNGMGRPVRTVFLSLEMGEEEIDLMWSDMGLYDNPIRLENENFIIIPRGYEMHLNTPQGRMEWYELLRDYEPELIIVDSLAKAFNGSTSTDAVITEGFNLVNRIRSLSKTSFIFLQHTIKPNMHGTGQLDKDAQAGSGQISANATSQVNFAPGDTPDFVRMAITKGRSFRTNPKEITILHRTPQLDFTISDEETMKNHKSAEKRLAELSTTLDILQGIKSQTADNRDDDDFDDF